MNNDYCNTFDDNQSKQETDLIQEEYSHKLVLFPTKHETNNLVKVNEETTNTSINIQGTIPRADIIGTQIAEKNRDKWIFNDEANCWMIYELKQSGVWSKVNENYIEGLINKELKNQKIAGYGGSSYITNIIDKMKLELIEIGWEEKSPTKLLPFQNCVLEISTGNILNHSREYRFTWCLSRDFDNSSKDFSVINQWLDEVTSNNNSIKEVLLCYLNAIIKGRFDLQQFLHLIGSGGTGKSTFVRLAQMLIGDKNVCTTTLRDFGGNKFGAANAYKKRLVVFPDQDKYIGDFQKFKSLTGQDFIQAEEKYKQPFEFRFDGMVIMASNSPVFMTNNSSWLTRRLILIYFNHTIDKNKRRDLEKEFQPELNALTQYLLTIPDEKVTQVLRCVIDNPELAQHTLEHQISTNPIAGWIDECVIQDANSKNSIGSDKGDIQTLFGSYTQWCLKSGSTTQTSCSFSPNLLDFCNSTMGWKDVKKVRTNRGFLIHGLRLRQLDKDDHIPSPLVVSVESKLHGEEWGVAS